MVYYNKSRQEQTATKQKRYMNMTHINVLILKLYFEKQILQQ